MKLVGTIANVVMWVIAAISVLLIALSATEAGDDITAMGEGSFTGTVISWTIGIFCLGILGMIVSAIFGVIGDTKSLIKSIIYVVGAAILVGVAWAMSDSTPLVMPGYEGTDNVYPWLNIADAGIYIAYFVSAVAVLSIIGSEIYQMFK